MTIYNYIEYTAKNTLKIWAQVYVNDFHVKEPKVPVKIVTYPGF
jgi:hypothetical protein